ncbi:hypothetical protein BCR34DRAFT_647127 [Clohesyomyces aquaticus]|uniref:Uncharacterized protein n=1 Tax=Clohesyomyces aquaticus TaxID=1231657 RepID=A0A1Y1ZVD0_9PLEO|nr:hypothetical protein BCR34DRAFT_647127 [Clohesyomyces aquaticus]
MSHFNVDLVQFYGPNFKDDLHVHTRNIRSGARLSRTHHCPVCKKQPTKRCYQKLHFAFCLAPIEINGREVICGERFEVDSPGGCFTHPYNWDYNLCFKEAIRGRELKSIPTTAPNTAASESNRQQDGCGDDWYSKHKPSRRRTKTAAPPKAPTKKLQPAMNAKEYMNSQRRSRKTTWIG